MKKKSTTVKWMSQFAAAWLLFGLMLLNQSVLKAQGTTSSGIKGYVFNNANQPLAGSSVTATTYLPMPVL